MGQGSSLRLTLGSSADPAPAPTLLQLVMDRGGGSSLLHHVVGHKGFVGCGAKEPVGASSEGISRSAHEVHDVLRQAVAAVAP